MKNQAMRGIEKYTRNFQQGYNKKPRVSKSKDSFIIKLNFSSLIQSLVVLVRRCQGFVCGKTEYIVLQFKNSSEVQEY